METHLRFADRRSNNSQIEDRNKQKSLASGDRGFHLVHKLIIPEYLAQVEGSFSFLDLARFGIVPECVLFAEESPPSPVGK